MIDYGRYCGFPYRAGGRGPDAFDCWGLVSWFYRREFGLNTPEAGDGFGWTEVATAEPNDVAIYRRSGGLHAGIFAHRGMVLNADEGLLSRMSRHGGLLLSSPVKFYRPGA